MCNCGKKRSELNNQNNTDFVSISKQNQTQNIQQTFAKEPAMYKYTGKTGLTIIGNITRKNYRFNFPGDIQFIEQSDVAGMLTVPVLRKIV